jgi:hypothetical protein
MTTYTYHSAKFKRDVSVTYSSGLFVKYAIDKPSEGYQTPTDTKTVNFIFYTETGFLEFAKEYKINYTKVDQVITFEMFWDAYAQKDCGRKKAEEAWKKLNATEQTKAFNYITHYNATLKLNNIAKKYATTFLNQQIWEK